MTTSSHIIKTSFIAFVILIILLTFIHSSTRPSTPLSRCLATPPIPPSHSHSPPQRIPNEGEKHQLSPPKLYPQTPNGEINVVKEISDDEMGLCFVKRLRVCAREIKVEDIPLTPPLTAGKQIEGDLLFGRLLYCMALQPEIHTIFDVFGHSGQGSSYLFGHGLNDAQSKGDFLINIEHKMLYWELQQTNLRGLPIVSLYGSTVRSEPHGPLLNHVCQGFKMDVVLVDGGGDKKTIGEEAFDEWDIVLKECNPKYLLLHNSNVGPEHIQWTKDMENNIKYRKALSGSHEWPETPQFPVREWVMWIRRD